jgi:hypothetical protein
MHAITERVWNGRSNTVVITVKEDGAVKDLSAVTRMVLEVGSGVIVDTDTAPADTIIWDTLGNVTLSLGASGIADGTYKCELVAYDPDNPDGVMLVHPSSNAKLTLVFETD